MLTRIRKSQKLEIEFSATEIWCISCSSHTHLLKIINQNIFLFVQENQLTNYSKE
jgi:hypothetical protein